MTEQKRINVKPDAPCVIANRLAARLLRDGLISAPSKPTEKVDHNLRIEAMADEIHSYFLDGTLGIPQTSTPAKVEPGYVFTKREADGSLGERLEFKDTVEGRSSAALLLLASVPDEEAAKVAESARKIRHREIPDELSDALEKPRGTIEEVALPGPTKSREVTGAFVTGSFAYGKPGPKSDLDLVVYMSEDDRACFEEAAERMSEDEGPADSYDDATCSQRWRFGRLDLIVCFYEAAFDDWQEGTQDLVKMKPVRRQHAVDHFAVVRSGAKAFANPPGYAGEV